jgi:transposase
MELNKRKALQFLYENGTTSPQDLSRLTGIPLRTCYNVKKRFENGIGVDRVHGSGKKSKLNSNDRRRLSQIALKHPQWSAARIGNLAQKRGSPHVSPRTIQRALKSSGIFKMLPQKIPKLTDLQKLNRVVWSLFYK